MRRRYRSGLHERDGVPAEENLKTGRKASVAKQPAKKCKGWLFHIKHDAEEKPFMRFKEFFPLVNRRNCDAEALADCDDSRAPLVVGDQNRELETEAVWAIGDQDIGKQRMGCPA